MAQDGLTLAEGSRLLHIGPHKTGTTAIQRALQDARDRLKELGVAYPGSGPSQIRAACAVTGARGLVGAPKTSMREWERLVHRVERSDAARLVISSEFFDMADDATAARIVEELGGGRVHVLVTLRPLAKILPSAYQQAVRARLLLSYQRWLERLFEDPPRIRSAQTFWQRHRHDVLIERWAKVTGPDGLTVVVLDESDRGMLLRVFEGMLALPADTLQFATGRTNRSLTLPETELVRQLNREFRKRGWSNEDYARFMRLGVVEHLQLTRQPPRTEPQITTPAWAEERVAEIGREAAERIASLGVRVVGDLATLGATSSRAAEPPAGRPVLPVPAVTRAVVGAIVAAGVGDGAADQPAQRLQDRPVRSVGGRELVRVLIGRARRRLVPATRRARRRRPTS